MKPKSVRVAKGLDVHAFPSWHGFQLDGLQGVHQEPPAKRNLE